MLEVNISINVHTYMGVSKNSGTLKSSILIGFSIINHPFWSTPIVENAHIKPTPFQEGFSHSELLGKHLFTGSSLKMGKVVEGHVKNVMIQTE